MTNRFAIRNESGSSEFRIDGRHDHFTLTIARLGKPAVQGEQFFQTNFRQGPFDQTAWRGGFNRWNPSWIIALVLQAALQFRYDAQTETA